MTVVAPQSAAGLPDGRYYFQVTSPDGKQLLSLDPPRCREIRVAGGVIAEYLGRGRFYLVDGDQLVPCALDGWVNGRHDTGLDRDHGAVTIQLMPYLPTPDPGGVHKVWLTPAELFVGDPERVDSACGAGCYHGFVASASKTDNFKVLRAGGRFPSVISVAKFHDLDGDGAWDFDEPEIGTSALVDGGGWPVTVTDPLGASANGFTPYEFMPGTAGTYLVSESPVDGWERTLALGDGRPPPDDSRSAVVNISSTEGEIHDVVFGNFRCLVASGFQIEDLDADGVWDAGEAGVEGWPVDLLRAGSDEPVDTTRTQADGSWSFTVCQGGQYLVRPRPRDREPERWTQTGVAEHAFTARGGMDQPGLDFFAFHCGTVYGRKFEDHDTTTR